MPYRVDICHPASDTLDHLVGFGALDVEPTENGVAAILPDGVEPETLSRALGQTDFTVSVASGRDDGAVWLLRPGPARVGKVLVVPAEGPAVPGALRLKDSDAFGTGHHPTTILCAEAIDEATKPIVPGSVLDVGTGSGVLALAALAMGVPQAMGLDIDPEALKVAGENACLNNLEGRMQLRLGGPEVVNGVWPLVVANLLAASLIEMAPILVRRLGPGGRLIVSGVHAALEAEVREAYGRMGLRQVRSEMRAGWVVIVFEPSW